MIWFRGGPALLTRHPTALTVADLPVLEEFRDFQARSRTVSGAAESTGEEAPTEGRPRWSS
jgi:hypothetical protein